MNQILKYISSQFKNPRGVMGKIICLVQNIVNAALYNKLIAVIPLDTSDNLLDIGFGNGHLLKKIYKKKQMDMYGIDISEDALKMATERNKTASKANHLHLQVGDCCDLPFGNEMFSLITSINTIYFWSDTEKGLQEIKRTLKPGKSFYNVVIAKERLDKIVFTQSGYHKFDTDQLIAIGYEAGFTKVETIPIERVNGLVIIYTK